MDPIIQPVFPKTAVFDDAGLWLGGCAVADLAANFGTPLYVYDAATKFDRVPLRKDDSSLRNPQYASMISDAPYVRELAAFFSVAAGDTDLSRFYGYEEDRQILGLIDRIERN